MDRKAVVIFVLKKKLRSTRGTTLTEVLIATALMALLAGGIGTGVAAAAPIMRSSMELAANELLLDTLYNAIQGELRYASVIVKDEFLPEYAPNGFHYFSNGYGELTSIKMEDMDPDPPVVNRLVVRSQGGTYLLLGDATYGKTQLTKCTIALDETTSDFTVELEVKSESGTTTGRTFMVHPMI